LSCSTPANPNKKTKNTEIIMQNKNILLIALAVAFILLLPLLAMQFSDNVAWTPFDFAVAGSLLFGTGLAYELIARKSGSIAYRAAVGVALAAALLLIWINLAVGILGSEDNPANLMYIGVLAVFIIASLIARFRPHAMTRALLATALVHTLVTVIALIAGMHKIPGSSVLEIVALNGFFVALWAGSALLFWRAHATQDRLLA
jgi:hypothetical protein